MQPISLIRSTSRRGNQNLCQISQAPRVVSLVVSASSEMGRGYGVLFLLALWTGRTVETVLGVAPQLEAASDTDADVQTFIRKGALLAEMLYSSSLELSVATQLGFEKGNLLRIAEKLSKVTKALAAYQTLRRETPKPAAVMEKLGSNAMSSFEKAIRKLQKMPSCQMPLITPVPGFGASSEPRLVSLRLTGQGILHNFLNNDEGPHNLGYQRLYDVPWVPAKRVATAAAIKEETQPLLIGVMAAVGSATVRAAELLVAGVAKVEDYLCTVSDLATWLPRLQSNRPWPAEWRQQLDELESLGFVHLEGLLRNISRGTPDCKLYLPEADACVLFKA